MSALNILETLLGAGKDLMAQAGNTARSATAGNNALITDKDKTTLGAGALAVLLGKKTDSSLATYGGLAALGTVAYKAFKRWQESQAELAAQGANVAADIPMPLPIKQISAEKTETTSRALLVAMITAAKSDGHIQAEEKAQLDAHFSKISDPQDRAWLLAEMNKPVDPAAVANLALNDPHLASQIYVLSVAMVDDANFMERSYLDELAKQLNLDHSLKHELEAQVKQQI